MFGRTIVAVSSLCWMLLPVVTSPAGDDAPVSVAAANGSEEKDGAFLLTALWNGREQLASGKCLVEEKLSAHEQDEVVVARMEVIFDSSKSSFRFEYNNMVDPNL